MNKLVKSFSFGQLKTRRFLLYYMGFTLLYVLIHYSIVSVVAFFHFLLDHELATIEQWLNYNGWEIILSSKISSFFIFNRILKLNFYGFSFRKNILEEVHFNIESNIIVIILYINILLAFFAIEFGGGISSVDIDYSNSLLLSFIGMTLFYLIDIAALASLNHCVKVVRKRAVRSMLLILPLFFYFASLIILPNLKMNQHFLFFNYFFLVSLYFKDRLSFGNILAYALFVISLSSLLWGYDLVWIDKYALLSLEHTLPWFGFFAIWLSAAVYYHRFSR
jgi:hypothetical protein